MESTRVLASLALLIIAGIVVIHGEEECSPSKIPQCSKTPESQTMADMCKASKANLECIQDLMARCPQLESSLKQTETGMKGNLKSICGSGGSDSKCNMAEVQKCSGELSQGGPPTAEKVCANKDEVQKSVTCMEKYLPDCSKMAAEMNSMVARLKQMLKICPADSQETSEGNETEEKVPYETNAKDNKDAVNLDVSVGKNSTMGNSTATDKKDDGKGGAAGLQASTMILSMLAVPVFVQVIGRI